MSATICMIERNKKYGFYQNDVKNRCVATFEGILPLDFIEHETYTSMKPDGTAVINTENSEVTVLSNAKEYVAAQRAINRNRATRNKHAFAYRVEKSFFDALTSDEHYETWSNFVIDNFDEETWLKEQLALFKKVVPNLDLGSNYYYVTESV